MPDRTITTTLALDGERKFKDAIKDINKNMGVLGSELAKATAGFDKSDKSIEKLTKVNEVLAKQMDEQKKKIAETANALEQAEKAYGKNSNEAKEYQIQLNKAEAALTKMEKELKDNEKLIEEQGKEADKAADKIDEFAESTENADKKTGKWADSLKSATKSIATGFGKAAVVGATAVSAAAAAVGVGMVNLGNDYNKMVNQLGASTGYAGESLDELGQIAKNVYANNFGAGLEDVGESISTVQRITGRWGDELQKATESGLALRDTFGYEIEESSRAAAALMKQFGISSEEAYNIIAFGAQNGADKNGDMLDTINEYAVQYKSLGLDAEQLITSLQVGAAQGAWSMDKVGDAVKEFNIRAKDGSKASIEAFQQLGLNADEMTKNFAGGGDKAEESFFKVVNALKNIEDPMARNTTGVALFGTQFEDLESGALKILAGMADTSEYAADSLEKINEIKYNDLGSALEGAKRALEVGLLPAASAVAGEMTSMAQEASKAFSDGFQPEDITAIGTMISEKLVEGLKGLSTVLPQIMSVLTQTLQQVVQLLIQVMPTVLPLLLQAGMDLIKGLLDAILANIEPLVAMVKQMVTMLTNFIVENLPMLLDAAIQIVLAIAMGIADALPELLPAIVDMIDAIITVIIDNLPMFIEAALKIIVALGVGLIQALPQLLLQIPKIWLGIRNAFLNIDWGKLGSDIMAGIGRGFTKAIGNLIKSAKEVMGAVVDGIKGFLGIKSPSRVMADQVGMNMGLGIAEGITGTSSAIDKSLANVIPDIENQYGAAFAVSASGESTVKHIHNGKLRIEGVNDRGQLMGAVDIIIDQLRMDKLLQGA
jgi:phage-related minor tail protein